MALNGCASNLGLAVLVFTLLPAQYFLPKLLCSHDDPSLMAMESVSPPPGVPTSFDITSENVPTADVGLTVTLLVLGVLIYICEWIQRKIKERRIVKLRHLLSASLSQLKAWDARQEQLESRLQMIENATAEYNLLLYLILHKNRGLDSIHSTDIFERELGNEHNY